MAERPWFVVVPTLDGAPAFVAPDGMVYVADTGDPDLNRAIAHATKEKIQRDVKNSLTN